MRGVHARDDRALAVGLLSLTVVEHQLPGGVAHGEHRTQFGHTEARQLGGDDPGEVVAKRDADQFPGGVLHLAGPLAPGHLPETADQFGPPREPAGAQPLGEPGPLVERHPLQLAGADAPRPHQRGLLPHGLGGLRRRAPRTGPNPAGRRLESPRGVLGGPPRGGFGGFSGLDRLTYGVGGRGRHGAVPAGLLGGLPQRLGHGGCRVAGVLPPLPRPPGPFPGLPGALQQPPQRGGLGEYGHGGGVRVTRRLPAQLGEPR
ncbi:hypothetical protein QFZ43_005916 [Streptomyces afghaniensis]|nr:hypothetical protein [Streptomyces afghaniensis]